MIIKKMLLLLAVLSWAVAIFSQEILFQTKGLESASIGYCVMNLQTGEVVAERNSSQCLTPASVTKIITTATALELLGKDFRFETFLEYDGELGADGVLRGNLYVRGSGDPTLGSYRLGDVNFLNRWAEIVAKKGIKSVQGAVVADVSLYEKETISPKWIWEDIGNYYAAGTHALSIWDNTLRVSLSSGAVGTKPKILKIEPEISGLKIDNQLVVKNIKADSSYFFGSPWQNERTLFGAVPAGKESFITKGDIPNPPLLLVEEFSKKLKNFGIICKNSPKVEFAKNAKKRTVLHVHRSRELAEIIKEINHQSNNFYAEHLLKHLALQISKRATLPDALFVVKDFWRKKGLQTDALFMFDGSGLAPQNAITPRFFAELLRSMSQSQNFSTFRASLPIAGESGTVRTLLYGTPLAGKVRAKSGSFALVQCYAGYLSEKFAFAILVNNFYCTRKEVRRNIEQFLLSLKL